MTEQRPISPTDRASPMPTMLLGCYIAALVYGTLYPWTGWRSIGVSPFTFLTEPIGRYWGLSDLITNVVMYIPMTMLVTLTRFARRRPRAAFAVAVIAAAGLSLTIEAIQSYLPSRVPSKLDLLLNTVGGVVGAVAGLIVNHRTRNLPNGLWHRPDLFRPQAGLMLLVLGAWIVAQAAPQRMLFETGAVLEPVLRHLRVQIADGTLPATWGPYVGSASEQLLQFMARLGPLSDYASAIESASIAASITAIGLITTDTLARDVPRATAVAAVLLLALAVHLLSAAWIVPGRNTAYWLSAGAQGGVLAGLVLLALLSSAGRRARLALVLALLVLALASANVFSPSVYHESQLPNLLGVRRNLDALLRAVSMAWPFIAFAVVAGQLRSIIGRSPRPPTP